MVLESEKKLLKVNKALPNLSRQDNNICWEFYAEEWPLSNCQIVQRARLAIRITIIIIFDILNSLIFL